ncbi:methyltransferase type 11 [Vibrio sp. UCD-FRSSP16_10]|uniref:class I SAM-dependent methyltransferase n=1 Tax=unclassified Vibrio TaxID=2614977 RepID=UPI00080194E5|nr:MULTISPECIES: class I SAM-dependent methyltransferase [unclassified Vibrio]OBT12121.1 methyltransferase type 11 [Vibrio sp. UCD-FRSSP16_30]OBT20452.1 methyltransferase type 11 [Vibrio sp. UCD-FRSSP16_10]
MKSSEIGLAYDQITERWNDDVFNRSNGISAHQKAIQFSQSRGKALDIGCGCTGRFIELLIEQGFQPSGIDVSSKMIELAKKRHPDISFMHADISHVELQEKYSFISAWDSLWHIPLSEQRTVLNKIVSSLSGGGIFIFSFGGTTEEDSHKNQCMGPEVYYSSIGLNGYLSLVLDLGCIIRHLEFDQHPELHAYLIVEKR